MLESLSVVPETTSRPEVQPEKHDLPRVSRDNARLLAQIRMDDGKTLAEAMHEYRENTAAFKDDDSAVNFMRKFHDPIARFSRIIGVHWSEGFGIALSSVKPH